MPIESTQSVPAPGSISTFEPGMVVAQRYRLGPYIDEGSYGLVFEAEDIGATGDTEGSIAGLAVKVVPVRDPRQRQRLRREIDVLRRLELPGVVRLHASGEIADTVFLVMDRVDGEPFPGRGRRRPWTELHPILSALLETLERVHARGIVHRDLKPDNVLVSRSDGAPTILDFGLSWTEAATTRITSEGRTVGSPLYLAPEQIGSRSVDRRADLYSIGVMLFDALTGSAPFRSKDVPGLLAEKANGERVSMGALRGCAPPEIVEMIAQLLEPDPERRPGS
ncbi:MAG: serine/threonine protein kinase, partial [Planctomycetes bacterium]|nr:serine/threonine protein kinase [Planctomycetota bacterium]